MAGVKFEIHRQKDPNSDAITRFESPGQPTYTMTNRKIEHKIAKRAAATQRPASEETDAENGQATATPSLASTSTAMIEAGDRLAQKLDQVAAMVAEQVQTLQQNRALGPFDFTSGQRSDEAVDAAQTTAKNPSEATRTPELERPKIELDSQNALSAQDGTGAQESDGKVTLAENARRLVNTLSRSRDEWQAQAADLQQALASIMTFLENQAASAAPKSDLAEIMSRLRNLEEEQRNLAGQLSTNRWGG
jgi:hypothetical protein